MSSLRVAGKASSGGRGERRLGLQTAVIHCGFGLKKIRQRYVRVRVMVSVRVRVRVRKVCFEEN